MQISRRVSSLFMFLSLTIMSSAQAYVISIAGNGMGSKWGPGPNAASFFNPATPPGTPGSATWSLMPAGVQISLSDLGPCITGSVTPCHNGNFVSTSIVGMTGLPDVGGVPYEIWAINDALNKWSTVSGFTNLGQVVDGPDAVGCGGLFNGCVEVGDIRIGAYPFNMVNSSVIFAHTFQPGTTAIDPLFGSIGGDMHFNNDLNAAAPNQVTWVDNQFDLGADQFIDFYTVMLHEIGHALGLDHSDDPNSVMALYGQRNGGLGGAIRNLTADDIAGVQAIYGPRQGIPEPGTLTLLGLGLGGLLVLARRSRRR